MPAGDPYCETHNNIPCNCSTLKSMHVQAMCTHANENPNCCECSSLCTCKENMCKGKRTPINIQVPPPDAKVPQIEPDGKVMWLEDGRRLSDGSYFQEDYVEQKVVKILTPMYRKGIHNLETQDSGEDALLECGHVQFVIYDLFTLKEGHKVMCDQCKTDKLIKVYILTSLVTNVTIYAREEKLGELLKIIEDGDNIDHTLRSVFMKTSEYYKLKCLED